MAEARGKNLVIVALPNKDDYVWKISSEKVPHLTLLFLGETDLGSELIDAVQYVEHAAAISLRRFGMSVDHRGELGEDKADVLFFNKTYSRKIEEFRSYLLKNQAIAKAYHSVPQFPSWTPHLTLGYPESPAKPDNRDYPGLSWVNFDRIAVWTEDSAGPEFQLKEDSDMEVSMSSPVDNILAHYGVRGMRWGIRRSRGSLSGPSEVTVKTKSGKKVQLKTSGGKGHPATEEAIKTAVTRQKGRASSTHALTNAELQAAIARMNLEQQYTRLSNQKATGPKAFIRNLLETEGKSQITKITSQVATQQIAKAMGPAGKHRK